MKLRRTPNLRITFPLHPLTPSQSLKQAVERKKKYQRNKRRQRRIKKNLPILPLAEALCKLKSV